MASRSRAVSFSVSLILAVTIASCLTFSSFAASPESAFIKKTIDSHRIVIFSKSYCPYCRRAKSVFRELDQAPHVVELDERDDGGEIQSAMSEMIGKRTVPQVFIDGKHIGGSEETIEAYESGELAELLGIEENSDL